ncbi:MAG: Do family serine endopeptidase [Pseudomonadota bacterium]
MRIFLLLSSLGLACVLTACSKTPQALPDFSDLVERNAPSVVNISTTVRGDDSLGASASPFPEGSSLGELFEHFFGAPEGEGRGQDEPQDGSLGSGFILDREGYILTNQHVIADAEQIIVRLSDRRELVASVVGQDASSDIALLKVDAQDLPNVRLGSVDKLKVGEWVLAIGTPFGFDHSVTAGIVSAKGRGIPNDDNQTYVPFIQTDVAINPGNSGGPLFNMRGEVVGINAQIYTESGGYMGLSFAIPIDMALDVAEQLKKHGHVSRGFLGVQVQDIDRDLAAAFGLDRPVGALVVRVLPDTPAERAGLLPGDVILEVNGDSLTDASSLPMLIGQLQPGDEAKVIVARERKFVTLRIQVSQTPDSAEATVPREAPVAPAMPTRLKNGIPRLRAG